MPSSLSCGEESVKRSFQEEILEACCESERPIRVRKVGTSGTNGVGSGTWLGFTLRWSERAQGAQM